MPYHGCRCVFTIESLLTLVPRALKQHPLLTRLRIVLPGGTLELEPAETVCKCSEIARDNV